MRIAQLLLQIDSGVVGFILRITLAVVMFPHGAQKVLGWFGGHGVRESLKSFTDSGIPAVFALQAIAAKFLGSPRGRAPDAHCGLRHPVRDARGYRSSLAQTVSL